MKSLLLALSVLYFFTVAEARVTNRSQHAMDSATVLLSPFNYYGPIFSPYRLNGSGSQALVHTPSAVPIAPPVLAAPSIQAQAPAVNSPSVAVPPVALQPAPAATVVADQGTNRDEVQMTPAQPNPHKAARQAEAPTDRSTTSTGAVNPVSTGSYAKISVEDMKGARFHWSIGDPPAGKVGPNVKVVDRDLNWVLENPSEVASLRKRGIKIICYLNLGRMQANPWTSSATRKAAYHGVYRHYAEVSQANTCEEANDKWHEPWISWKPKNQATALHAYQQIVTEASKACQGLDYDNTDTPENIPGGQCGNENDVETVLNRVCDMTHKAGMSCFMKNSFAHIPKLAKKFDGVISEQCFTYKENAKALVSFKGKPIACIEYKNANVERTGQYAMENFNRDCQAAQSMGISNFWVESEQEATGNPVKICPYQENGNAVASRQGQD